MKTAVSIPDDVYRGAERLALESKKSRSRLYSDAVREYVARHATDQVTEAMDRSLAQIQNPDADFARAAAHRILTRTEW